MADLFQRIEDRKDEWNVEVMVTFLEIYNEEIRDLLAESSTATPRGGLQIREDKSVKVVGLNELRPNSAEEVKEIVLLGNTRRTQSPTHANETSSRSHAVLQVHVTQAPRTADVTEQRTMATLSIIDLAGSERAAATSNMGQRMVEGANINKSLLALGNCINALCENGGATRHVPYRNSKLTRLLKFSLGGNCKTVMIVCVAPTSNHFDDTHNTLLYAERATKIKTKVVTRNVVNVDRHVGRYVEAINRLNIEVAELKAKLAGKLGNENDIAKRKKAEANAEVQRAKSDMQAKVDQTRDSIIDGATCTGKLAVANAKLAAIRVRLSEIDALATSGPLSSDLDAERGLLQALAGPEELAVKADSGLNNRLRRSENSGHMFDATLRAVSERRSDRLDEVSIDNVKMDARSRQAEMGQAKAEAERDALKTAVAAQAELVVSLVGMVGRCTVMIGEAGRILKSSVEEGRDGMEGTVRAMVASLRSVSERNDEAFTSMVGYLTAGHLGDNQAIDNFKGHSISFTNHSTLSAQLSKARTRKLSAYAAIASPPRRTYRTPRKSLRSSFSQPYRQASDKEKDKKSVQWRDEAGQGDLDDAGDRTEPSVISVTSADSGFTASLNEKRTVSLTGSESEWEDEKTDDNDSFNASFVSSSATESRSSQSRMNGPKRPRASRLDPGFLKPKGTSLGSLVEDDENGSPVKRGAPLSDRNVNQLQEPENISGLGKLHVPKGRDSSARRVSSTPRIGSTTKRRRTSNIGPMRSERSRRRSSQIPQPFTSEELNGGSRRPDVLDCARSPANRPGRLSAVPRSLFSMKSAKFPISVSTSMSSSKSAPTWR